MTRSQNVRVPGPVEFEPAYWAGMFMNLMAYGYGSVRQGRRGKEFNCVTSHFTITGSSQARQQYASAVPSRAARAPVQPHVGHNTGVESVMDVVMGDSAYSDIKKHRPPDGWNTRSRGKRYSG
jgi:hypothetical protein